MEDHVTPQLRSGPTRNRWVAVCAFLASLLTLQMLAGTPLPAVAASPPPAPTGLAAVATLSFNSHLTWTDNSGGSAQYVVNNGSADSKDQPAGAISYDWGGQPPNTYMCFTVRAINAAGSSPAAGPVCTTTPAATCGTSATTRDASDYVDFYHGTSLQYAQDIRDNGISLSVGDANTDFGRGFYITTDLKQAQEWATQNFSGRTPTVVHYRVAHSQLTPLNLCGLVFPSGNADFLTFVRWFRDNKPPLGGAGYDFVEGPLLFNPSKYLDGEPPVIAGQQDSIHSARATAVFNAAVVELLEVPPVKVMVVGDSISQGSAGDFTWRYRFYKHETAAAKVNVQMVGPRDDLYDNVADAFNDNHTYADANFDQRHDAFWGRSLAHGAENIESAVTDHQPDYLLVLLGINDLSWGISDPAGTEASLRSFIANARTANPRMRFVFGSLLPNQRQTTDSAYAAAVADYNSRLASTVASLSTPDSPMVIADDGADFVPATDTWDGTHPNAQGEVKIAAAFADALATKFYDHSHGPGFGVPYPRPYPTVPIGPQTAPELTATAGDGEADLTWTLSPGATGYYVYVKNVTAGETDFTKLPWAVPGPFWTAGLLVNGATYEFQLGATKGTAEGVRSNIVTVTPTGVTPNAVTDLTATPGDQQATLTWTPVPNAAGYYVQVKNVSAGETSFSELPWPVSGPSWTAGLLQAGGRYEFRLQSVNGLIRGGLSNVAAVTVSGATPAGATNLTVTPGNKQATLSWTPAANATGYYVQVKNVSAGETSFSELPWPVSGPSWTAGLLQAGGRYEFRLQSVNGLIRGGLSNVAAVTVSGATPAGPANLTVTPGDKEAALSWTAAANATGYYVYVKNVSAGETSFSQLPWPVTGTSWTAGLLQAGGRYEFQLQSVNDNIRGGFSNVASVTLSGADPAGPTNLTATPGNKQATLNWTPAANATGYYVYVKNISAGETSFSQLPWPVTGSSWVAGNLAAGGVYQFQLQSINDLIRGGFSNVASVTASGATPGGVTNLTATPGDGKATLSWTPVANATGYYVYVKNVSAGETSFSQLPWPVSGSSWVASTLTPGGKYQFQLQSINDFIRGGFSNIASVTVSGATPGGVTNLTATAGNGKATLSWTPVANATGYYIYVKNVSAGETSFSKLPYPVPGPSWVAGTLTPGGRYEFRLQSVNGLILGGFSNIASVTVSGATPAGVTNLTATAGNRQATLRWTEVANATGYYVYVKNVSAGETSFSQLPWPVSGSSWVATTLVAGGRYEFRLQSVNGLIRGGFSNIASVTASGITPTGVTNLTATPGNSRATLSWTRVANATGYYIYVKNVSAGETTFSKLPYAVPGPTWVATTLVPGGRYQFQLRSINGLLLGGFSNIASVTVSGITPTGVSNLTATAGDGQVKLAWTKVPYATGYYVHITDLTIGQSTFTELPYPVPGPSWTAGMLINGHVYRFELQSVNGLLRGGISNSAAASPRLPSVPPTSRTASVTTGWIHAGSSFTDYVQLYDVTGRISGYRSGGTMTITEYWSTSGHHLYLGSFWYQLFDCTTGTPGNPVSGTPYWNDYSLSEQDNPTITSATQTVSIPINSTHYYVLRVTGGGQYDSQREGKQGDFSLATPPFTSLIPFDARTNCF